MPYGIDKKQGGDNPSNDKFVEKCVNDISGTNKRTGKPYTKGEKIAICKTALKNRKAKAEEEQYIYDYAQAEAQFDTAMNLAKEYFVKQGHKDVEAEAMLEPLLVKANFDITKLDRVLR